MDKRKKSSLITAIVLVGFAVICLIFGLSGNITFDESLLNEVTGENGETLFPEPVEGAYNKFETTTAKTNFIDNFTASSDTTTHVATQTEIPETQTVLPETEVRMYSFRNESLYKSHYEKHGAEFGDITEEEYLQKANDLIASAGSHGVFEKIQDDGDRLLYNEKKNEFIVISPDGYIRTFFRPSDKKEYFDRQ